MALVMSDLTRTRFVGGLVNASPTNGVVHPHQVAICPSTYTPTMGGAAGLSGNVLYNLFPSSLFGIAVGGIKSLSAEVPITGYSGNSFNATSFVIINVDANVAMAGAVGVSGSGGDMILDKITSLSSLNLPKITAFSFKWPATNDTVRLNEALRNTLLESLFSAAAAPLMANGGLLTFYSGTQPTLASDSITTQSALATITFATTDFGTASSGSIGLAASKASTYVAAGTATWARWAKGAYVLDMSVGTASADAIVSSTTVSSGSPPTLTSLTLSL